MEKIIGRGSFLGQIVRGVVTALLTTLVSVLVFAFILSVTNLSDGVIKPINQIIKVVSVFLGCFLSVREDKGFVKGGLIGLISAILTLLIFSLLAGGVNSWGSAIIDLVCGFIMGGLSGVISVNLPRKRF